MSESLITLPEGRDGDILTNSFMLVITAQPTFHLRWKNGKLQQKWIQYGRPYTPILEPEQWRDIPVEDDIVAPADENGEGVGY